MRKCKDHMKIGRVDDFSPTLIHPDFFKDSLAVWAVAVTAGIIMYLHMPTVCALAYIDSKFARFTVQNSMCSFSLNIGLEMVLSAIRPIRLGKYFLDPVLTHSIHLPENQKD